MEKEPKNNSIFLITAIVVFLVILTVFSQFPLSGDDWFREEIGQNLRSVSDLFTILKDKWNSNNARVFGNILAYTLGSREYLRLAVKALISFSVVFFSAKLCGEAVSGGADKKVGGFGKKDPAVLMLLALLAMAPMPEIFAQSYQWNAGFFNYVTPVACFIACTALCLDDGKKGALPAVLIFVLAFAGQFCIETSTVQAAFGAIVLFLFTKKNAKTASFALGTVSGAVFLFISPAYSTITTKESGSSTASSLSGMIEIARSHLYPMFRYYVIGAGWIALIALIIFIVLLCRGRKFRDRPMALCVFFVLNSLSVTAPLLVVNPIGPRQFIAGYLYMAAALACVFSEAAKNSRKRILLPLFTVIFIGLSAWLFTVYKPLKDGTDLQMRFCEEALAAGAESVELPSIPETTWVWAENSPKMESLYPLKISFK